MTQTDETRQLVQQFWATMATNDFHAAAQLLSDDYVLEWPQSGERIRGPEDFAEVNEHYPAAGRWEFTVRTIIAEGEQAVSDVHVTDGAIVGRVITFSTVIDGKILKQLEFWPDPFEPAGWQAQWVERM